MSTRRIVPRGDGEGGLGTALKRWGPIYTTEIHADNISMTIPDASESEKGLVQLASAAEVNAGTDAEKAVVPATLHQRQATDAIRGLIELATSAEVIAGTDTQRAVTPAGLQAARAFASTVQAEEGTLENVVMSPATTLAAINANAPAMNIQNETTNFTAARGNLYQITPPVSTTVVVTLPTTDRGKMGFRLMDADEDRKIALDPGAASIEDLTAGDRVIIDQRYLIVYVDWDADNSKWRVVYEEQNVYSPGISRTMRFDRFMHVQDQKPSGTAGGTFTAGAWQTRDLNTVVTNTIAGASLNASTSVITLPAGKYWIEASAPVNQMQMHKTRLNCGGLFLNGNSKNSPDSSTVCGYFEPASETSLTLEHRCTVTVATSGFGSACNFGVPEIYSEVKIWEVS